MKYALPFIGKTFQRVNQGIDFIRACKNFFIAQRFSLTAGLTKILTLCFMEQVSCKSSYIRKNLWISHFSKRLYLIMGYNTYQNGGFT